MPLPFETGGINALARYSPVYTGYSPEYRSVGFDNWDYHRDFNIVQNFSTRSGILRARAKQFFIDERRQHYKILKDKVFRTLTTLELSSNQGFTDWRGFQIQFRYRVRISDDGMPVKLFVTHNTDDIRSLGPGYEYSHAYPDAMKHLQQDCPMWFATIENNPNKIKSFNQDVEDFWKNTTNALHERFKGKLNTDELEKITTLLWRHLLWTFTLRFIKAQEGQAKETLNNIQAELQKISNPILGELINDTKIWHELDVFGRRRLEIESEFNEAIKNIARIIYDIESHKYSTVADCCPKG